ncbi:tyrosine--tRNA ligase, chloroplastic/mitochondrial-like isoform X2 [Salvia splendens]|uniref:tyrosine--tRNA ligase, chloroplastic/mitochondrial-like isoform X2 n=1 Tax=Salvia splendens TaxID=180675 RepID=UPI001C26C5D8|nr:tyrosine--tRNA ligase, chloroplastic/mitochondrial-like isoform X2 [Salvia splendens]
MAFAPANCCRTLLFATTRLASPLLLRHLPPLSYNTRLYSSRGNVVQILEERGLLDSLTADSLRRPDSPSLRVYCGFDPTADSLHIGNLLGLIVLSWFLRCGHRAVALVGGATGRVGDPSGKSLERPQLDLASLDRNVAAISASILTILERVSPPTASPPSAAAVAILNNYDWWKDVKLLDFLRDVGRHARVGAMMSKESVRRRLESEQGMSYTEFTYQLLQGYDFLHLFRDEGVNVQIGGSDQWGNITAGTDLIRRILQTEGAYGLTFPLLLKSDGTKFGKSEDGAVWLSPSLLSPYQFYQYFFSISDADVVRFLKILTFLPMDEISKIEIEMQSPGYSPNSAQRRLSAEVTRFVHGDEGLAEALKATEALRPGAETKLDSKTIESIAEDVPSFSLPQDKVLDISLVDLSVCTGLLESKSAARRLLKQGGLYLNNNRVDSEAKKIEADDIVDGKIPALAVENTQLHLSCFLSPIKGLGRLLHSLSRLVCGGLMSGLTLGLMSLSLVDLEVLIKAGKPEDRKNAEKILPIVKNQHLLLCTLLICNALAMEALPIFVDSLLPAWGAVLISVTLILAFGEIIPQAVCSRYGLNIGARLSVVVRLLVIIVFPLSYPISKLLDLLLGKGHSALLRRAELKTLVDMHGNEAGKGGELSHNETTIISGALDLTAKTAKDAMTPLSSVFSLDLNAKLDNDTMGLILSNGHSRVPVYLGSPGNIVGLVLVNACIKDLYLGLNDVAAGNLFILLQILPWNFSLTAYCYFQTVDLT